MPTIVFIKNVPYDLDDLMGKRWQMRKSAGVGYPASYRQPNSWRLHDVELKSANSMEFYIYTMRNEEEYSFIVRVSEFRLHKVFKEIGGTDRDDEENIF